jgi:GxxExxY protein
MDYNKTTETIIGAAIEVHRHLGPGLLESTYEACLAYELTERGLKLERQKVLPVKYLEVVAKPHRHFFNVTMTQASWKKATNILI